MLPDIAATEYRGAIIISWNNQYSNVRSIAILRSDDSLSNFATIAHMKTLDKSPGFFVIRHPHDGQNCYKLDITFNSGLEWMSNYRCVSIDKNKSLQSTGILSFDSVKKMITTRDAPTTVKQKITDHSNSKTSGSTLSTVANTPKPVKASPKNNNHGTIPGQQPGTEKEYSNKTTAYAPVVSVSLDKDTDRSAADPSKQGASPVQTKKKITIPIQAPEENAYTLVKSGFIYTNATTGHIIIDLPNDVATHHYSVKFYDDKNEMITEIPKINTPKIIVDKRNFQKKGMYKFKLRRDLVELETGYLIINPNP